MSTLKVLGQLMNVVMPVRNLTRQLDFDELCYVH